MARLSLCILGPFQAALDGKPVVGFESDRVRALLAYLAVEAGRPHYREELAGLLWPERSRRSAHDNLRQALSNLRQAIGDRDAAPPFLLISREAIQFNPTGYYWLDAAEFVALLAACEGHQHPSLETCEQCAHRLRQAAGLYRGRFLEQFFLKDTTAFDEWSLFKGEWLHRLALEVFYHLAEYHWRRGEYEQARRYAWRQVELEPWREEAHRQLMQLHFHLGERSAALAQYITCSRALAEELGAGPGPETQALYHRILESTLPAEASVTTKERLAFP